MDALKAQLERIRQQLAALSSTQKMLVIALIAVMVMTIMYWGRYAGTAEMVPVLDQTLEESDIGAIDQQLRLAGVTHTVTAGKVMVPADRKDEILADLMFARALPQDTHSAFETMSKEINPFMPNTQVEMAFSEATAMELSSIISRFPGVASARVIINAKDVTKIEGSIPPSATVFITTKGEPENAKTLARAAAEGVAHAVSGLSTSQISVIMNGMPMKVADSSNSASAEGDDLAELRAHRETDLEQKIRNQFSYIPGLTVTVNCDIENRVRKQNSVKYDKAGTVVQPIKTVSNTEETSNSTGGSHEPGTTPNTNSGSNAPVALTPDSGSGGGNGSNNTSTIQHDEATNGVYVGQVNEEVNIPAGKDTVQSATVRVPSSYFATIYRIGDPKATTAPKEFVDPQLASIKDGVKKVLALQSDDALSVDTYMDLPVTDMAMAAGPAVQSSALNTVGGHAKEIGIAVLAVVSLLMMATMVRKSSPVMPSLAGAGGQNPPSPVAVAEALSQLGSGESVAGEVGGGAGALDGMEMDEDAVRTQQMLDQVSTMVKENPDSAASLVKKWLSRT
jgi:flagellar biosynthesis/type III secretory pathway M-ring protein FliF/YscJ